MAETSFLRFVRYVVDRENEQLRLDNQPVRLTNKAFAVLRYLVEHPWQLVTKEALFAAVWPETVVSETTLTNCIGELRRALGDDAKQPQFIETVHRRGYRFIAKVVSSQHSVVSSEELAGGRNPHSLAPNTRHSAPHFVGREVELAQLHNLFTKALSGQRQVVFVTGEGGIGKTALVDAFRQRLEAGDWRLAPSSQASSIKSLALPVSFAHGQCVEQYGVGEAYLPVLEALGRLGRQPGGERLLTIFDQYAPTWLLQLPALLSQAELEVLQRRMQGATRERMLREITEAFDVLSTDHPLVLVLEDLHWSDPSTVELLTMLACRRESARLFIVGTYRAAELAVTNHPLKTVKQELVARGQAEEIALNFLSPAAVREYVSQRVAVSESADSLAEVVYQRTDGQPLFMVQMTDYLTQQSMLTSDPQAAVVTVKQAVPQGLRELIEAQLGRLTEGEQHVLEAGSVAGAEFVTASVAAGLAVDDERIEAMCDGLARRGQFIEDRGVATWPDGRVSERYGFRHALYQEVFYNRLSTRRRVWLHRQLGERIENGYGEHVSEVAVALAMHFERGHDYPRAILYLRQAAENALRRYAYHEALTFLTKGLALLAHLPESAERAQKELALLFSFIQAAVAGKGHASVDVKHAYTRVQELSVHVGNTRQLFSVLLGLFRLQRGHGEYQNARNSGAQCLALAQRTQDTALFVGAYYALGASELLLGDFALACEHLTQGVRQYDAQYHTLYLALYGSNPVIPCRGYAAAALWFLGHPDQALQRTAEMLSCTQELAHPPLMAVARCFAPFVYHCCRLGVTILEHAEQAIPVLAHTGIPVWQALGTFWRGWGLAEQGHYEEGIQQMQQGLTAQRETGSSGHRVHFSVLLAEAYGHAGQCEEGLRLLAEVEADMEKTDERYYEAELWRIKGELTLQQSGVRGLTSSVKTSSKSRVQNSKPKTPGARPSALRTHREAEAHFQKAIEVARRQQAKSLELRAVMSLVRLRRQQALEHKVGSTEHGAKSKEQGERTVGHQAGSTPHVPRNTQFATRPMQHEARRRLNDAHQMLSEIYNWFTEGFDTKDLQEAQTLLTALSSIPGLKT
jgi:DNA-binding winged helix-turn-helix (wHTH) protein/predicted ATPase